jgi:hypothetical protein
LKELASVVDDVVTSFDRPPLYDVLPTESFTDVESRISCIHCVGGYVVLPRPLITRNSASGIRLAISPSQDSRDPDKTENGERNFVYSARFRYNPPKLYRAELKEVESSIRQANRKLPFSL